MKFEVKSFGTYNEETYDEIFITNDNNVTFSFSDLGARINQVLYPYKDDMYNLILGYKNAEKVFLNREFYYGATIGRVAGRIEQGQFILNDTGYQLPLNDGKNHIHGGKFGLDISKWEYTIEQLEDSIILTFTIMDAENKNGYPGNTLIKVMHKINNDNQWQISYQAKSDRDTIFDPTNHVYFNLNKSNNSKIYNHNIMVNADYYVPVNQDTIAINDGESVKDTVFDLTNRRSLEEVLKTENKQIRLMGGLDHAFIFNNNAEKPDVFLENNLNDIKVKMKTDRPSVILYTHNKVQREKIGSYLKHQGITMEAQSLPNSINLESYKDKVILKKDKVFKSVTTYTFYE